MKKIIIGLLLVATASASALAQDLPVFTGHSRDNMVKLKVGDPTKYATGTVIAYEDDMIYILTAAHAVPSDKETIVTTVKENKLTAKNENIPDYYNITAMPFIKDAAQDLAVIKISKLMLPETYIKNGNFGFSLVEATTDTSSFSTTRNTFDVSGFHNNAEQPEPLTLTFVAHNYNKDAKYFEMKGEGDKAGYAGAMLTSNGKPIGLLLTDTDAAKVKVAKMETILAFLKKNGIPSNLITNTKKK